MRNKIKNSRGIALIPLICIIVAVIVVVAVAIVFVTNGNSKPQTDTNTIDTNTSGDDDFFNEPEEGDDENDKENQAKEYENNEGVTINELFDSTGEEEDKLHIGDFVDYTAGSWTKEQISKINANGEKEKPKEAYKFGGYTTKMSRDESVVPCDEEYDYAKEKNGNSNEKTITGWRVFDITDDEIILISAGCPEDYYHPEEGRSAYISQYILTGEVNENINAEWLELGTKYKKRTWKEYVNSEYYATDATVLTKTKLDEWYSKYISEDADIWKNDIMQKIYDTNYENLIDNYAYYWLATPYNSSNIYGFFPKPRAIGNSTNKYGNVFGIRVLVHLPVDIKFKEESIGTKTVISRDNSYDYNIWEISR